MTCPVFQSHGTADRIVPLRLGEALHARFPAASAGGAAKRWHVVAGGSHNGLRREGGAAFAAAEAAFLRSL